MVSFLTAAIAFFKAIPAITGGINNFANKYFDTKVQLTAARLGADVNVVKAAFQQMGIEATTGVQRLQIIANSKGLMLLLFGWSLPWIIYEWKVVVWDNVWMGGLSSTPEIKGLVATFAGVILGGIFGTGGGMILANAWMNRKDKA